MVALFVGFNLGGRALAALDPAAFTAVDVGSPTIPGSTTNRAGVVGIQAGGTGIGFSSDQFHFAATPHPGDFDVQARVSALTDFLQHERWAP